MYQALYRKYRSKTFDELLGQKQVTIPLKNQIIQGQTSHAYLFSGSRGTGKTSAAKIFSRAVNCLHPIDGNPCNECENCKLILEDRMMDVVEMDAASNNGVDDIRELKERVVYPPGIGRYKVYIIDEVHMLSKGAFNALLKILEEPPKHLIFYPGHNRAGKNPGYHPVSLPEVSIPPLGPRYPYPRYGRNLGKRRQVSRPGGPGLDCPA